MKRLIHAIAGFASLGLAIPSTAQQTTRPSWEAELPFTPQAAVAQDGVLSIAKLVDGEVRVSTASLSLTGLSKSEELEVVWGNGSFAAPMDADTLMSVDDYWVLYNQTTRDFAMVQADAPTESMTSVAPVTRLDAVEIADGFVFLLGEKKPDTTVASISLENLAAGEKWILNPPVPDPRRNAALIGTSKELYIIGGEFDHPAGSLFEPTECYATGYGTDGHVSFWEPATAMRIFERPGALRGTNLNGLLVFLPRENSSESLRFLTILDRQDGTFSLMKELSPGTPALSGAFVTPYSEEHLILIGGGTTADGASNTRLYGWRLPETTSFRRLSDKRNREKIAAKRPGHFNNENRPRFQAGLGRASDRNQYHVALLLDDSDESRKFRQRILRRHNVKLMFKDVIVSQTWPEELEEAKTVAGTEEIPAMMLLTPGGKKVGVLTGMPADQEIFELLKPVWAPANPSPNTVDQ